MHFEITEEIVVTQILEIWGMCKDIIEELKF